MNNEYPVHNIKEFLFGGSAEFSLKNELSGQRYVFYVSSNEDATVFFVRLLTGPEETSYLGTIFEGTKFCPSKKSMFRADSKPFLAFKWLLGYITAERALPSCVKVCHLGNCCRCGRPLTNEASIQLGIGPTCLKKG